MNIHFLTYGDKEYKYLYSAERVLRQAKSTNWFGSCTLFNLNLIKILDIDWYSKHIDFINNNPRGNGYWLWKPKIIQLLLKMVPDDDLLVYLDAGCEINIHGNDYFETYLQLANKFNLLAFSLKGEGYRIEQWTKRLTLDYFSKKSFHIDSKILELNQIESGVLFLRKCHQTVKFIDHWLEICEADNYIYLNDVPGTDNESNEFIDHRHDNAIFTLLILREKFGIILENDNYFPELWSNNQHPKHIPIATFRNLTLKDNFGRFNLIDLERPVLLSVFNFDSLDQSKKYILDIIGQQVNLLPSVIQKNKIDINLSEIIHANNKMEHENLSYRRLLIENQLFIYDQKIQDLITDNQKRQIHIDLQNDYLTYLQNLLSNPIRIFRQKQEMIEKQSLLISSYQSRFGILNETTENTSMKSGIFYFLREVNELLIIFLCNFKSILVKLNRYKDKKSYKNSFFWTKARFIYHKFCEISRNIADIKLNYFPIYLGKLHIYEPINKPSFKSLKYNRLDEWPTISIVTPSFNSGPYIKKTIDSLINQCYPSLEYFIQDNLSSDETQNFLKDIINPFTKVSIEKDFGQSDAINKGFKNSSGEIMSWINADDVYAPGVLFYIASYFKHNPHVDVLYGDRVIIDENDYQIGHWVLPRHDEEIMKWVDYVPQETMFWRRSIWNKVGGSVNPNLRFAMDWDLILRFQEVGANIVHVPKFLACFRVHKMQKTSNMDTAGGIEEMKLLRKRSLGFVPNDNQISISIRKYILRHRIVNKFILLKGVI